MRRKTRSCSSSATGALLVGSPDSVARKIVRVIRGLGLSRFDLTYSMGAMPHEKLMESIRPHATEVVALVRKELA
jgi:alkanesulfonate monooxygenase SsuD/methylene tetrahydromethanopterin reductase-like flavin-dependent oxidoreductase (luciferase family)